MIIISWALTTYLRVIEIISVALLIRVFLLKIAVTILIRLQYISSAELCALCGDEGLVDGCHPTDFGFASMSRAIIAVIEENGIL